MAVRQKLAVALVVLLALIGAITAIASVRARRASDAAATVQAAAKLPGNASPLEGTTRERRSAADPIDTPVSSPPATVAPAARIAYGLVIDLDGTPQVGFPVVFRSMDADDPRDGAQTRTDSSGRFSLEVSEGGGGLGPADLRFTALWVGDPRTSDASDPTVVVVAPSRTIAGLVTDQNYAPIEDATVEIKTPPGPDPSLYSLEHSNQTLWYFRTDKLGRFRIDGAPALADETIAVWREGYTEVELRIPNDDSLITARLSSKAHTGSHVSGRVLDARGVPVQHAWVFMGGNRTYSELSGAFAIDPVDPAKMDEVPQVVAFGRGWLPVRTSPVAGEAILTLHEPAPSIRGRVIDAEGRAVAGAIVMALDPVTGDEVLTFAGLTPTEAKAGKEKLVAGNRTETDEQGRFELPSLLPRSFRLRAHDKRTLATVESEKVQAGAEVEIRFSGDHVVKVAGRVVDSRGKPIENTLVCLRRGPEGNDEVCTDGILTDSDGRFSTLAVDRDDLSILVYSTKLARFKVFARSPGWDLASLSLVVGREGHLRVEIATPGLRADTIRVMSDSGEVLWLAVRHGGAGASSDEWDLDDDGRAGPLLVSEEAATLVLYRESVEVTRMPIRIAPGELTVVRP